MPSPRPNAEIAAAIAAISAPRIERHIRALAGFGTRSFLSDTRSDVRGIGAAARWIQRELQACADETGGRLQVARDEHIAPIGPRVPRPTPYANIVATLPGSDPAARERLLIVSGHYDSRATDVTDAQSDAPGANDDASGVAAMMEMACTMSRYHFGATLVFMAVAGEEQGLIGSEAWAEAAHEKHLDVDAMITNDIIGSSTGDAGQHDAKRVRLFADGLPPFLQAALFPPAAGQAPIFALPGDTSASQTAGAGSSGAPAPTAPPTIEALRKRLMAQVRAGGAADFAPNQLGRQLKETGERYMPGFSVQLIQRPDRYLRGGDHLPFLNRGYAAVRFTEPFENFAHQHQTPRTEAGKVYGDLPEFVDFNYLADVTRVNLAGLATLARAPAAPRNAVLETVELTNDTTLHWDAGHEAALAGYRVVWRDTGSPVWQHARDVGMLTRATLPVSKDNVIFGVQAIDAAGDASIASFPMPGRR